MRRFRRLRASEEIRSLVQETRLSEKELIYPVFVKEGENIKAPVDSMPGIYQWSPDRFDEELDRISASSIAGLLIFVIPERKDELVTEAYSENGITQPVCSIVAKDIAKFTAGAEQSDDITMVCIRYLGSD